VTRTVTTTTTTTTATIITTVTTVTRPLKVEVRYSTVQHGTISPYPFHPLLRRHWAIPCRCTPSKQQRLARYSYTTSPASYTYISFLSLTLRFASVSIERPIERVHEFTFWSSVCLSVRAVPCRRVVLCECATVCNFSLLSCPISAGGE